MHSHVHPGRMQRRLLWGLVLTGITFFAELIGGLVTGSLALLSDAAHVFLDMFALGLAYGALRLSARPASERFTYGLHRTQVLAALVNGATLAFVAVGIVREAIVRLTDPRPILAGPMVTIAVVGLAVNLVVALLLRAHDKHDLGVHSAFLHVLGDALGSLGTIAAGTVILLTGWTPADALASLAIATVIMVGAVRVLRRSLRVLAEGAPEGISVPDVARAMQDIPGVEGVHDLHVWAVAPGYPALSAHVVLGDQAISAAERVMAELRRVLHERFSIEHTTLQVECAPCSPGSSDCPGAGCGFDATALGP